MVIERPLAAACVAVLTACAVDVPLDDLECPCARGWACVPRAAGERCERVMPESCRAGTPPSSLAVVGLRVAWRTPLQARFHWQIAETIPMATTVSHYELWVAADADRLMREELLHTYDGSTNPELAFGVLPFGGASSPVEDTTATDLEPGRSYAARLLLYDASGGLSCSEIVPIAGGVIPGANSIPIVEDSAPPGSYAVCSEIADDPAESYEGTSHLFRAQQCQLLLDEMGIPHETALCEPPGPGTDVIETQCWTNLIYGGIQSAIDRLSPGKTASAFLELFVRVTNSRPVFWAETGLLREPLDGSANPTNFYVNRLSVNADDQWHVIQIPLTALSLWGAQLPGEEEGDPFSVAAFPTGVNGFRFGAVFDVGASIRVDSVRIRW